MSEHDCLEPTYTQAEFDKYADLMEKKVNRLMGKLDCERANAAYWLEQEVDRRSEIIGLARERDSLRAWKANAQITLDYDKVQLDALADDISDPEHCNPWTFYRDDSITPYIGAKLPYPTRISGEWRWGKRPERITDLLRQEAQK